MKLYHGSNCAVETPMLVPQVRALDFGRAFYLTSDLTQASRWARTSVLRRGEGEAFVSVFELDEGRLVGLKVMSFPAPARDWLSFISRNRNEGIDDSDADLVTGPVANDNTMPVLNLYFKGAYTEEEALRRLLPQRLLPQRLCDQYAFKTPRALAALSFVEAVRV